MLDLLLADLVVLIHIGFVLFVVLGGLLALRWRWVSVLQLPAALWGAMVEFGGLICPLTPLENQFRMAAGGAAYTGDFVVEYLVPLLYPSALTRELQFWLGGGVCLINLIIYLTIWLRSRNTRRGQR